MNKTNLTIVDEAYLQAMDFADEVMKAPTSYHNINDRKRETRSSKYQYLIQEASVDHHIIDLYDQKSQIGYQNLAENEHQQALILWDKIRERLWMLVCAELTDRQREALTLVCAGGSQAEIGKKLGCGQSNVNKTLLGNVNRTHNKNNTTFHGGLIKKIRNIYLNDPILVSWVDQYSELVNQ